MKSVITAAAAVFVLLGGCAQSVTPPVAQLRGPNAALLVPPEPLPEVAAGNDGFKSDAQCSAAYVEESGKLRSLQGWTRTVLKKK